MPKAATKKTAKKSAAKKPAKKSARKVVAKKATRKGAVKKASAKKIRPQGRRQEGHAQRGGEEGIREEGRRQARASQAQESDANADPWIVGTRRRPPNQLARCGVSADQVRPSAVRPRLISLFVFRVRSGTLVFDSMRRHGEPYEASSGGFSAQARRPLLGEAR